MKYIRVGEIFEHDGEKLKCYKLDNFEERCENCYFDKNGGCIFYHCTPTFRKDQDFVIFKKEEK